MTTWVSEHSMQNNNVAPGDGFYEQILLICIGEILLICQPIYIGMPMHQSGSSYNDFYVFISVANFVVFPQIWVFLKGFVGFFEDVQTA